MFDKNSEDIFLNTIIYLLCHVSYYGYYEDNYPFYIDEKFQKIINNENEDFTALIYENSKKVRLNLNIDISMIIKGKELYKWIIDYCDLLELKSHKINYDNELNSNCECICHYGYTLNCVCGCNGAIILMEETKFFDSLISQFYTKTLLRFEILEYLTDFYNFVPSYDSLESSITKKTELLCFMFRFIPNFYNEFLYTVPFYNDIIEKDEIETDDDEDDEDEDKDNEKQKSFDKIFAFMKSKIIKILKKNPKCLIGYVPDEFIEFEDRYIL